MAIGLTVNAQNQNASQSITLGGTCKKLVVSFTDVNSNTGIGVTYNGVALTQAVSVAISGMTACIFYMDNPPTGSAYTLAITGSGSIQCYVGIYELTGTSGGVGATASNSSSSLATSITTSITTTKANSLILNAVGVDVANATSNTNSETERYTGTDAGSNYRMTGSSLAAATVQSYTTGYNTGNGRRVLVAVEIKEPTALSLSLAQGSYTYTGFALLMTRTRTILMAYGSYAYTGYDIALTKLRNFTNRVKNITSWTNRDKTE
tara:strand:+ start:285 stop:1076 length:792 start_codon:yes stop_codon:yes gene_type:complete